MNQLNLVNSPEEADVLLFWVIPKSKSLFESNGQAISLLLSDNNVDTKHIQEWSNKKPTLLAINFTKPWVIDEIFNTNSTNIKGVLATFGTTLEALLDIISGQANPQGKMPFSTPRSVQAVLEQKADLPGFEEPQEQYALFNYDEGLNY